MGWGRGGQAVRAAAAVAATCAALAFVSAPVDAQPVNDAFLAGSGRAVAGVLAPTLNAGQLAVSMLIGEASARYQDETAVATSTAVDVPLLGLAGGLKVCQQRVVPAAGVVPTVTADTNDTSNNRPVDAESSKGAVTQSAHARPRADARAETRAADLALPGLIALSGASAEAQTRTDAANLRRVAHATTRIASVELLAGLVRLEGLRWDLTQQQVGADSRTDARSKTGAFSVGRVIVGGVAAPTVADGAKASLTQANKILAPLGVQLRAPVLTSATSTDRHSLSPLQIVLGGEAFALSPVFAQIVTNPSANQAISRLFASAFDPKECAQFNGVMKQFPALNAYYNTVGSFTPLLLAVASGVVAGGDVTLNIGGAATSLDDTYVAPVPFGGHDVLTSAPAVDVDSLPSTFDPLGLITTPTLDAAALATTRTTRRCATTSPAGRPGCWAGQAPVAGALAAAIAVGVFATDEVVRRRRTRGAVMS